VKPEQAPPREAIRIEDSWYVLATSARAGEPPRVLKHGESFALFDRFGDMPRAGTGDHGLFHQGTRFLSLLELRIEGQRPLLLHSSVRRDNSALVVDATNPDLPGDEALLEKGTVHLSRSWVVWDGGCRVRLGISNYGRRPLELRLSHDFAADFVDIFEVRGYRRERRGRMLPPSVGSDRVVLAYEGLDEVRRRTHLHWSVRPARLSAEHAEFVVRLDPHGVVDLHASVHCETGPQGPASREGEPQGDPRGEPHREPGGATRHAVHVLREEPAARATVRSPDEQFNAWVDRSASDLSMLIAGNPEEGYPYAGVPWYSVPFGRDGIITALQYLWVDPSVARGVLTYLARTQAIEQQPERDAEPGKVLHETRKGELAALGEIPFGRYYGTVDATPLFIVLAGEYYQRTRDRPGLAALWPSIVLALDWIDRYGDIEGDGYVEYRRRCARGLVNQGWKDSEDSVFHDDGTLAEGPVALCEVQAYVYLAKVHAARLARVMGQEWRAVALAGEAEALRERFERDFWCEELGTYVPALDGGKRQCRVRSSNAGHALWCGIASEERARRVADLLMSPDCFSGWGVRTIARGDSRYNPMSYHNGSVWPHDNSLIAMGMARYGMKEKSAAITAALYEASLYMDLHRLPELFCGFDRREPGDGPTLYPVACSPQAWASASAFYLLKACLGLSFRPDEPRIRFLNPVLPPFLDQLRINDLRVGNAVVDVDFRRRKNETAVQVFRKQGDVQVSVVL
jgi:glycogen debranching enzyme